MFRTLYLGVPSLRTQLEVAIGPHRTNLDGEITIARARRDAALKDREQTLAGLALDIV
jgi:hypothetical protein